MGRMDLSRREYDTTIKATKIRIAGLMYPLSEKKMS